MFCVAVPSPDYTAKGTPIVSGALALLMQARPGLPVRKYVRAILETASHSQEPEDLTGRGLLNVEAALQWLYRDSDQLQVQNNADSIQAWLLSTREFQRFSANPTELVVERMALAVGIANRGIYAVRAAGVLVAVVKVVPYENGCQETDKLFQLNESELYRARGDLPGFVRILEAQHNYSRCFQVLTAARGASPFGDFQSGDQR